MEQGAPGRFAYADPPYPGLAKRYYGEEDSYAGEVDHEELLLELEEGRYLGWALSTSARALEDVLPLVKALGVPYKLCAWVKPIGAAPNTYGLHNCWEPLIVARGRQERPGKRDWLKAQPARRGGDLMGRKPIAFCSWLFECMGMRPGDELVDVFPGTGVVGRSWGELSSAPGCDASSGARESDPSVSDASRAALGDA